MPSGNTQLEVMRGSTPDKAAQVPQEPHCICPLAALRALRLPPGPAPQQQGWEGAMVSCAWWQVLKIAQHKTFQRAVLQWKNPGWYKVFQGGSQKKWYESLVAIWLQRHKGHWSTTQFTKTAGGPEKVKCFWFQWKLIYHRQDTKLRSCRVCTWSGNPTLYLYISIIYQLREHMQDWILPRKLSTKFVFPNHFLVVLNALSSTPFPPLRLGLHTMQCLFSQEERHGVRGDIWTMNYLLYQCLSVPTYQDPQNNPAVLLQFCCFSSWCRGRCGEHTSREQRNHAGLEKGW